jgi:hypothetical protein
VLRTMDEQLATLSGEPLRRLAAEPASSIVGSTEMPSLLIVDGALAEPMGYRQAALDAGFRDITFGAATFHGIQPIAEAEDELGPVVRRMQPLCEPTVTFFRHSPAGTPEPNFIHRDTDMGEWTAILYLTPHPPPGDGTTFWQHEPTGFRQSAAETDAEHLAEGQAWRDLSQWTPWRTVAAKFNRLLLFPARAFHSRAIPESYGTGDDARLIQVMFGRYRR